MLLDIEDAWEQHSDLKEIIDCDMRSFVSVMDVRDFDKAAHRLINSVAELLEDEDCLHSADIVRKHYSIKGGPSSQPLT